MNIDIDKELIENMVRVQVKAHVNQYFVQRTESNPYWITDTFKNCIADEVKNICTEEFMQDICKEFSKDNLAERVIDRFADRIAGCFDC